MGLVSIAGVAVEAAEVDGAGSGVAFEAGGIVVVSSVVEVGVGVEVGAGAGSDCSFNFLT